MPGCLKMLNALVLTCGHVRAGVVCCACRSLYTGAWEDCFWVVDGPALYLYRSYEDFSRQHRPGSDRGALKMIKLSVALKPDSLKTKKYDGVILHNFFLVERGDFGDFKVAKFGSRSKEQVGALRNCLLWSLHQCKEGRYK